LTYQGEYVLITRTHTRCVEVSVNKGELVDAIAADANLSKTDAESALNAFINSVQSAITAGEKVTLPGFGTFSPALRKARTGMDPRTREPVQIPERKSAKFSVGSKFKAQVQGS
jgi:DNA-binding protein HU-beta